MKLWRHHSISRPDKLKLDHEKGKKRENADWNQQVNHLKMMRYEINNYEEIDFMP